MPNDARDPICGMMVDSATASERVYDGESYFFCCEGCAEKFEADPAEALKRRAEKDAAKSLVSIQGCCHGKTSSQPAKPDQSVAAQAKNGLFICPMHPEIEQVGFGECPICGMDLEPKFVSLEDESGDQQYREMLLRFQIGVALCIPLLFLAMGPMIGIFSYLCFSPR